MIIIKNNNVISRKTCPKLRKRFIQKKIKKIKNYDIL
jgi:hypothetical protein